MTSMRKTDFGVVDLDLLKRQKAGLLDLRGRVIHPEDKETLDGVINLMDAIQDWLEGREWR